MPWCLRAGSRKVRYRRTASASNCDWRGSVNHRGKLVFCTSILVKAPPLRERDGPPSPSAPGRYGSERGRVRVSRQAMLALRLLILLCGSNEQLDLHLALEHLADLGPRYVRPHINLLAGLNAA